MKCRCKVLNTLSGDAARDYANAHLEVLRSSPQRTTTYECPETGVLWIEENASTAYAEGVRRLRRADPRGA